MRSLARMCTVTQCSTTSPLVEVYSVGQSPTRRNQLGAATFATAVEGRGELSISTYLLMHGCTVRCLAAVMARSTLMLMTLGRAVQNSED
jgi:hypothetical protein